jgi:hypothetical protein
MKTKICVCTISFLLFLTSCSGGAAEPTATPVDISAMQTAAVASFIAGMTQTAAAYTPTPQATETPTLTPTVSITETPGITSTPTEVICDGLVFISDVTVPDGTTKTAGEEFVKTWKVKNTGSCTWTTGYNIIFAYGEKLSGQTTALTTEVLPNAEAEISITLKAPLTAGEYKSFWRLANNNNSAFGTVLTVDIIVQ